MKQISKKNTSNKSYIVYSRKKLEKKDKNVDLVRNFFLSNFKIIFANNINEIKWSYNLVNPNPNRIWSSEKNQMISCWKYTVFKN